MNVSGVPRAVRSMGLSSRPAFTAGVRSATASDSRSPFGTAARGSTVVVGVCVESDMKRPSNPMLGVGIIRLDSCVVNYPRRPVFKVLVRRRIRPYLPHRTTNARLYANLNPRNARKARLQAWASDIGRPPEIAELWQAKLGA